MLLSDTRNVEIFFYETTEAVVFGYDNCAALGQ